MANVPYRQLVGSLMYLANGTRPDLAHALNSVARFCANPGRAHWNALKWILRYLVGTKDLCIRYGKKVPDMPFSALHGNVDGSYGDDVDDRRSTTGLRISLDLDRLALGGVPSRTRYPAVLVIQLAHSREITLGDNLSLIHI